MSLLLKVPQLGVVKGKKDGALLATAFGSHYIVVRYLRSSHRRKCMWNGVVDRVFRGMDYAQSFITIIVKMTANNYCC